MSHPEILLTTTGAIGLIFLVIFAGIIPICISAKATKDEEYDDEEDWMNALVGMYCFWVACAIALLTTSYVLKNGLVGFAGFALLLALVLGGIFFLVDPGNSAEGAYYKTLLTAIACLAATASIAGLAISSNTTENAKKAANATFDQTITYHLDANEHKLEGETLTYPINSLRTNNTGDTYTWVEHKEDGTLATRSVQKVNDDRYEVTLKDDLPATDTEARVERIIEYQVKSDAIAAGKEACVYRYAPEDFGLYPRCDDGSKTVKFVKARTIIHIPAGTVDKMVPVSGE